MLDWFLVFMGEQLESSKLLYQLALLVGSILLTILVHRALEADTLSEDESDSESEDNEEAETNSGSAYNASDSLEPADNEPEEQEPK